MALSAGQQTPNHSCKRRVPSARRSCQTVSSPMRKWWFVVAMSIPALAVAAPSCPNGFDAFLSRFEQEQRFQAFRTQDLIAYWHVDHDDLDMKMKGVLVRKTDRKKYETYPTRDFRIRRKLERHFEYAPTGACKVRFYAPDSDAYAVDVMFRKSSAGWCLIEVQNHSL